jgi:NAD(P)-dependent dehydrogenase (short-subunit alcohol dehydrogenase family)
MAEEFPRFDLAGQIVLVTGTARGLGRACALACAKAGADIVLGLRDVKAASGKDLAREIEALGRRALPLQMDVAHLDQIESAIAVAEAHFGRIDVLVNNAGIGPENLAENVNEADFDATLSVNLKGTFFAAQAAGRRMIARKSGRIINMSSQAGQVALKGEAIYCMTKAGIDHMTRCLVGSYGRRTQNRRVKTGGQRRRSARSETLLFEQRAMGKALARALRSYLRSRKTRRVQR